MAATVVSASHEDLGEFHSDRTLHSSRDVIGFEKNSSLVKVVMFNEL